MDTKKPITILDGEVSETEIEMRREIFDLELKALECKSGKLRMELEHKQSKKKRTRPTEQSGAGEVTLGEPTGDRIHNHDDHRRGGKRIKLEPRRERATARPSTPIDLSTPSPVLHATRFPSRNRVNMNYEESDLDLDSSAPESTPEDSERSETPSPAIKHTYEGINKDYPSICKLPNGSLAELRCSECGSNATFRSGRVYMLEAGISLQRHYIASHREFYHASKCSFNELMNLSIFKILSAEEADQVKHATSEKYIVDMILSEKARTLYDLRFPAKTAPSNDNQMAVSTPHLSTERDEDDEEEEEEVKPPGRRGRTTFSGRTPENVGSAASTGMRARKTAPGGGLQALNWQR